MTVLELKKSCEEVLNYINNELDKKDAKVILNITNDNGSLFKELECVSRYRDVDGNLYLSNHEFKNGNCL